MSDNNEGAAPQFTEEIEQPELSAQDIADLEKLNEAFESGDLEAPSYHTILQVWREILSPITEVRKTPPTPRWSVTILGRYQGLTFADMGTVHELYFDRLEELRAVLLGEIAEDEECLNYTSAEEDIEHNTHHYKNLLLNWQLANLQWELDWKHDDADAAAQLAAMGEVHNMFFSQTGIVALLDQVGLEMTEADSQDITDALEELRGSSE